MAQTKICGLSTRESVAAAVDGGARWIGFVFYPKSPRNVSPEVAAALAAPTRGGVETVAVTVDADDGLLARIADTLAPDYIQFHGTEDAAAVHRARRFAKRGVIKAIPIARSADFAAAEPFSDVADFLLFDAKAPAEAALPGGNGAAFDWRLLKGRSFAKPWLLSGGLTPGNIAAALLESGARLVDVSSGVESAPGVKDATLIGRFLAAARMT